MPLTEKLLDSKQAASKWATLFLRALPEVEDVEEGVLVANLAYESLPVEALLAIEDAEGHLHSEKSGQFVAEGKESSALTKKPRSKEARKEAVAPLWKKFDLLFDKIENPDRLERLISALERGKHGSFELDDEEYSRIYTAVHSQFAKTEKGEDAKEDEVAEPTNDIAKKSKSRQGRKEIASELHSRLDPILWRSNDEGTAHKAESLDRAISALYRGENMGEKIEPSRYAEIHAHVVSGIEELEGKKLSLDAQFAWDIDNRKAQGILNRTIEVSKKLNKAARLELQKVLRTSNQEELSRGLIAFIRRYRVLLADLLTTTQLASLLEGAREVARSIPVVPMFPNAVAPPATLEPAEAVLLLDELKSLDVPAREAAIYELPPDQQQFVRQGIQAQNQGSFEPPDVPFTPQPPQGDVPERIHYPIIDEAARDLAEKNVMTRAQFDALDSAARQKAFTIANVESMDTLQKVRDVMAETIKDGVDVQTFRERVMEAVDEGTFLSDLHMETVYRTNIQTAFSDGQMTVLQHPFVKSGFPYAEISAIHDDRTRHNHEALETLGIGGTAIYRLEDPVFQLFRGPWDFNCFLPGTMVQGRFNLGLKSWYSGETVEIVTSQGNRLTVTANHPVLTPDGFIAAKFLKKGDDVLSYRGGAEFSVRNRPNSSSRRNLKRGRKNNNPAKIEEVFKSLANFGAIGSFPLAPHHLHGDAEFVVGNIQVVGADSNLLGDFNAKKFYRKENFAFSGPNMERSLFASDGLSGFGDVASLGSDSVKSTLDLDGFPSSGIGFNQGFDFQFLDIGKAANLNASLYQSLSDCGIAASKSNGQVPQCFSGQVSTRDFSDGDFNSQRMYRNSLDFAHGSQFNAAVSQDSGHRAFADISLVRQLLNRRTGDVAIDKIISVVKRDFSHWVYDLQSPYGFMIANSIVTSNCRCGWTPMTVRQAARAGIQEAINWLATGIEPENKAFVPMPSFRPPPGFQRSLSGMPLAIQLSMQPMPIMFAFDESKVKRDKDGQFAKQASKIPHGELHHVGGIPVRRHSEDEYRIDTDEGHITGNAEKIGEYIAEDHSKRLLHGKKREAALERSGPKVEGFSASKSNREIEMFKGANPGIMPQRIPLSEKQKEYNKKKYDFYMKQGGSDADRLRVIEANFPMAPIIISGEEDDWWITDGDHRLAVAAHLGNDHVMAYAPFGKTSSEADAFSEPERHKADAEGFAALPKGAKVVSLDPNTHGRVGIIVKDEEGRNRVKLEGSAGYASDHVEPLDEKHSWRVEKEEAKKVSSESLFDEEDCKKTRSAKVKEKQREIHGESLESDTADLFSVKPEQSRLFSIKDDKNGQWITIGGKPGEDGKKHGGSPVFVVNGRITKGHPSLTGKKLGALKEDPGYGQSEKDTKESEQSVALDDKQVQQAKEDWSVVKAKGKELTDYPKTAYRTEKAHASYKGKSSFGNGLYVSLSKELAGEITLDPLREVDSEPDWDSVKEFSIPRGLKIFEIDGDDLPGGSRPIAGEQLKRAVTSAGYDALRIKTDDMNLSGDQIVIYNTEKMHEKRRQQEHRQEVNREKEYVKAVWAKKARKEGIDKESLSSFADEIRQHHNAFQADVKNLLQETREAARAQGINVHHKTGAFEGGDHTEIKGFDLLARQMAGEYPHILGVHGYSDVHGDDKDADKASEKLFELLQAGNPEMMDENQAYEEAFDYLLERKKSESELPVAKEEEEIPFSLDASGHEHKGKGEGGGQFEKVGHGSTGEVYKIGNEVEKSGKLRNGDLSLEGDVYKALAGIEGIAKGRAEGDKIRLPHYKNILGVDTVPEKQRRGLGVIVAKNKARINQAVTAVSDAGYDYNDPLQFGVGEGHKLDLLDFSNANHVGQEEALQSNIGHLKTFYYQFGMPDEAKRIGKVADTFQGIKSIIKGEDELGYWQEEVGEANVAKLKAQLDGREPRFAYYATNGRHVGIGGIAQTETEDRLKVLLSDHPLTDKEIADWELTPVIHSSSAKTLRESRDASGHEHKDKGEVGGEQPKTPIVFS